MGDLLDYTHGVLIKLPVPRVEGVKGEISAAWISCGGHVMGLLGSSQGNFPCDPACILNLRLAEATQTAAVLVLAISVDAVQNNSFFFSFHPDCLSYEYSMHYKGMLMLWDVDSCSRPMFHG